MVNVRKAVVTDSEACSEVLCSSIRTLCLKDHNGEEETISKWLANKTPKHLEAMILTPSSDIFVAVIDEEIVGVGGLKGTDEITLNYVSPPHRFSGISKFLLSFLENELQGRGCILAKLVSTRTAHNFYRRANWNDNGEPETWLGMYGYPMSKPLR